MRNSKMDEGQITTATDTVFLGISPLLVLHPLVREAGRCGQ